MTYNTLVVDRTTSIATVTLNRPEKRNAISYELIEELLSALEKLKHGSTEVVVFTGAGQAFCSGMDLDNLRSVTRRNPSENLHDSQTIAQLFRKLYEFPRPTIAAVNGPAVAGGCGLATLCDFTLASTTAKFGYPEVRIGFTPAIVAAFLVRQVGEKHARELLLSGRTVSAEEAYRIGLVNEVVAPEALIARARELASQLIGNSPSSMISVKRILSGFAFDELNRDIQAGIEENARIRSTRNFHEGVTAFLEKRKPKWESGS